MKEIFVYYGGNQKVPKDVERVRIDPSVRVIQKEAFEFCRELKYVQFCEGVTEIGEAAFQRCSSLESVRMASTTRIIQKAAFQYCTKLRYLLLNEGLEVIGLEAFENCESIEFLELPSTMRRIHGRAFRYCKGLRNAVFHRNLEEVCANAFQYCTNWKSLVFDGSAQYRAKTKFGHGSKKWIPGSDNKDETFWKLVSSNADNADKVIMANCGMFLPSDHEYWMSTTQAQVQNLKAEMEARHAREQQKYQKGIMTTLETWKKTYFCLQAQYNSLQLAYYQVAAREENSRRRLQAMTAHYGQNMAKNQPPRTEQSTNLAIGSGPKTNTMGPPIPRKPLQIGEKVQSSGATNDKPNRNDPLKRKMPMQDSTNQQKEFKKLRPVC